MRAATGMIAHTRIAVAAAILVVLLGFSPAGPVRAQNAPTADTLLVTPTTQGEFVLPHTGVTLAIAYASVDAPAHVRVTRAEDGAIRVDATGADGVPLLRFEMPLIVAYERGGLPVQRVVGWPGVLAEPPAPGDVWLVVFDAHGVYTRPAARVEEDAVLYLGPLAHFSFDLLRAHPGASGEVVYRGVRYRAAPPLERAVLHVDEFGATVALPTAARDPRYRDRFIPEDLRNPGGWMLLGAVTARDLPDVARALAGRIPADPDIPAPGVPAAPIPLLLPFDCTADWTISWGYHHSTPQNRFAVDFAALAPGGTAGQGVYAAHAGSLLLKRFGTPDHAIDTGLTARVVAPDGITSTVYGHLDDTSTRAVWGLDGDDLPPFEWVAVGEVAPGDLIGVGGATGYATGPHIHFALWSWDQSLYQPVPLGGLDRFERGMKLPRTSRAGCDRYR